MRFLEKLRPTAIVFAAAIVGIVWMSYHFTGELVGQALTLINTAHSGSEVKDGVIQLLTAVAQNMVAVGAVTGLVGALNKLCEDTPPPAPPRSF